MKVHPTSRSRILGAYVGFKGISWALMGLPIWWAALRTRELETEQPARLFAYYILLFVVPGLLLWVVGRVVRVRHPVGWYLAVIYLLANVVVKTEGGFYQLPAEAWQYVSHRVPPDYLMGVKIFGILAAVVFAMAASALLAFLSPRGRECFNVRRRALRTVA